MLIVALVMATIGLAALVTAIVTGNEVLTWLCIAVSGIGVVLLTVDTLRVRRQRAAQSAVTEDAVLPFDADYPDDLTSADALRHRHGHRSTHRPSG